MRQGLFTLFAMLLFVAACSRTETKPQDRQTPPAVDTDHYLVQNSGNGDGEVARSATREALLKELEELTTKLAAAKDLNEAFKLAESIEDLGMEAAPELQAKVKTMPVLPRIAGWRAVWTLGSLSNGGWDAGVKGLLEIVKGENEIAVRVAAAEVLGAVASTRHEQLLREALKDKVFDPEVRVQLAVALWRSSKDTTATSVLRELLASDNDAFKIRAALALGEINQITQDAKPLLEMLADEPTLRGRIAKRALDYERAIKRFEAAMEGRLPGTEKVDSIDTKLLDTVEKMIKERYIYPDAIAGRKLLYAAASGMLEGFDPYTCLLEDNQLRDAGEIRRFAVPTLGLLLGSAKLNARSQTRLTRVLSVKPGSPAQKAGIRAGDRIYRVVRGVSAKRVHELRRKDDLPDETTPFQLLPLDEAVSQFQGALGTTLGISIMRDGWLLSRWVHMTHSAPDFEPVTTEMLPGGIGMIHVVELNASSPVKVREGLEALKKEGLKTLILDLRNCAGGSVEAATQVAASFLPKGTLVTLSIGRSPELAPRTEYRTATDGDSKLSLTVLVDGGTADSGEVLAGALQEHGRAKVAGTKTFGRAIVQELIALNGTELEQDARQMSLLLTVARFMGPVSGMAWYDRGVTPDTELTPRLFEGWIYDELEAAYENPVFSAFMDKLMSLEQDKLLALAKGDGRKTEGYPGFAELEKQLALKAGSEELRFLVRQQLRVRLLAKGADVQLVDLQEDDVFTGTVKAAAAAAGIDLSEIPEYAMLKR